MSGLIRAIVSKAKTWFENLALTLLLNKALVK